MKSLSASGCVTLYSNDNEITKNFYSISRGFQIKEMPLTYTGKIEMNEFRKLVEGN